MEKIKDLNSILSPHAGSRNLSGLPTPIVAAYVRDLTPEDLLISAATPRNSKAPSLTRIRTVHHKIARMLAAGQKAVSVSEIVGVSQSRISILQADPAFIELLEFYQAEERARYVDVRERIADVATTAIEVLQERLEESPESFEPKDLIKLMETAADRSGYAPVTRKESVSVTLSADDLRDIKQSQTANVVQRNPRTILGTYRIETTEGPRTEEDDRCESEGESV